MTAAQGGTAGTRAGRSGSGAAVGGGTSGAGGTATGGGGGGTGATGACGANTASDVGVTATSVKLGATVAESGIAQSFLGEVRQAMEAVKNKANRAGGVCGRQLSILYKDDGWSPDTGARYIQNLVQQENVFALAVVPSSEGLNQASQSGYFRDQRVPVIGSDGMIKTQYNDPYIWPVAAATTTTLHIMMREAWDRGARNPAIVYENNYRFGVEGAHAFNEAYKRLSGRSLGIPGSGSGSNCVDRYCGIASGQGQYGTQVGIINSKCGDGTRPNDCDFMVLLLEPKTAQDWMAVSGVKTPADLLPIEGGRRNGVGMGGAQPLFTFNFGKNCGDKCARMRLWTGYNPPIEQYANQPAVAQYGADLAAQSGSADKYNQFTEGGYVGMQLVVEALKKTGSNLTRARLRDTLDSMTLSTGLTRTLTWRAGQHYANGAAQAFSINSKNGFTGWEFAHDYITDPWLGQDAG